MLWTDTKRIIRSGWKNFKRSGATSLASVLVMTITISVITTLIFLQAVLTSSLSGLQKKIDVTVYFTTDASETQILSLKSNLEKLGEVASVAYTPEDQVLQDFRDRHKDDSLIIQALDEVGTNPFGAVMNIKAKDPTQYESIVGVLDNDSSLAKDGTHIIDKIDYTQNKFVIDRLNAITKGAHALGFAVTLILVLISIIITFNTIRLTIFMSREEIGVMRLVGAENKHITGPYMIAGIIYGIIASVATMVIFVPITLWLGKNFSDFLGINAFNYFTGSFFQIFSIALLSGVLIGIISSYLAIRKYLKK